MYYDDEGRRFNVLSGLLFGTLLGAGITLLVAPQKGEALVRPARRLARSGRRRARRVGSAPRALESLGGKVFEAVAASVADAWRRSG